MENKENEIWKSITNLLGYEISSYGNIKNSKTKRILKQKTSYGGYQNITILKKNYFVHRLVAQEFIINNDCKPTVNHINRIRNDNYYKNLEWSDYKEQTEHTKKQKIYTNNNRIIYQLDKDSENIIAIFQTIKEASLKITNDINKYKNISLCALGKIKTAYGYKWKYKEDISLLNETWKYVTINNKDNIYKISNYGRIKNNKTNRILKLTIDNNGYYNFNNKLIHRLVAETFLTLNNDFNIVNHLDGNKLNNYYENLEWTNLSGNAIHSVINELRKNIKKVAHIDTDGYIIKIYNSCSEASRDLNVNCRSINKCCKGLLKTCGESKYMFKYLDNNINNKVDQNTDDRVNNNIDKNTNEKIRNEKNNRIKINIFTRDGKYLDTCNSILDSSKKYKVNSKTIVSHCKLQVKHPNLDIYFRYCINQ